MNHEDDVRETLKGVPISILVAERMARDPEYAEYIRQTRIVMEPILVDLAKIGCQVEWLSELRKQTSWAPAIPVLLHWLPLVSHHNVKLDIIRCLSVPSTGNKATAYFIEEFKKTAALDPSYAWAVGNALSIVGIKGFAKEIINLCRDPKYGKAREMLVFGLNRLRTREAEETALDLLDDEGVRLHAIITLGKMKSKRALFHLEKLLSDEHPLVRKEARKAITKIMR